METHDFLQTLHEISLISSGIKTLFKLQAWALERVPGSMRYVMSACVHSGQALLGSDLF